MSKENKSGYLERLNHKGFIFGCFNTPVLLFCALRPLPVKLGPFQGWLRTRQCWEQAWRVTHESSVHCLQLCSLLVMLFYQVKNSIIIKRKA